MEAQKVDAFILANGKNFQDYQIPALREMLLNVDDNKWLVLQTLQLKDPTIALIISLLAGTLGIDRFYIGDMDWVCLNLLRVAALAFGLLLTGS